MNINTSIIDQRITKIIDGAASRKAAIFEKLFITEKMKCQKFVDFMESLSECI